MSPQRGKVQLLVAVEQVVRSALLISVGRVQLTHSHNELAAGLARPDAQRRARPQPKRHHSAAEQER